MATTDYVMYRGNSKTIEVAITDSDGDAVDVSTAQAIAYGIFAPTGGVSLVTKTLADGVSVVTSTVTVALESEDAEELIPGIYIHELKIIDSAGKPTTALQGTIALRAAYLP